MKRSRRGESLHKECKRGETCFGCFMVAFWDSDAAARF